MNSYLTQSIKPLPGSSTSNKFNSKLALPATQQGQVWRAGKGSRGKEGVWTSPEISPPTPHEAQEGPATMASLCLWSSFIWQEIGDHSLVVLTASSPWEHTCLCSRQWAAGGKPYPLFSFPFQNFSWSSPSWAALLASSFSSC